MKKNVAWVRTCLVLLLTLTVLCACSNAEVKAVRAMPVNHVDLAKVKDGNYRGDFSYGGFTYEVQVTVVSHQIKEIAIIKNRTARHAKMAEDIVKSILGQQKNDVDVVSGATTTSKALLKAVENALEKGL
ncbi:MAG: FMN-binding protein [Spirochaetia bacterium]|jgi:uncharacterized protein with FMN-binding domain